jgi:cellobiose phosphorylase
MAGLKLPKAQMPQAKAAAAQKPTINVAQMNIPAMLAKQLNIGPQQVQQLMAMLKDAKSPQDAITMIKQFDRNPQTMNQPYNPQQQPPQGAGLQLNQGT